jgi:hypothetical protein
MCGHNSCAQTNSASDSARHGAPLHQLMMHARQAPQFLNHKVAFASPWAAARRNYRMASALPRATP